nr:hypothetical protein [Deltaproteobacteria bacterium]
MAGYVYRNRYKAEEGAKTVATDILDEEGRKPAGEIKDRGGEAEDGTRRNGLFYTGKRFRGRYF